MFIVMTVKLACRYVLMILPPVSRRLRKAVSPCGSHEHLIAIVTLSRMNICLQEPVEERSGVYVLTFLT